MSQIFSSLKAAAEQKLFGDQVKTKKGFQVAPHLIVVEPGFNRPISRENVDQFKSSIRAGAEIPDIWVRVEGSKIIMVDGEHRLIAVRELIEEGMEIPLMSCKQFTGNDAERIAHLCTSSQGQPLSQLDAGVQYKRLSILGWEDKKIADRVGKSISHVIQCKALADANTDVHQAIARKEISPTLAADVVREHGSKAGAVIAAGLEVAKGQGKAKVTAKQVKAKKPEQKHSSRYLWLRDVATTEQVQEWLENRSDDVLDGLAGIEKQFDPRQQSLIDSENSEK